MCACDVDSECFLCGLRMYVGGLPCDIDFGMAEAVADLRTDVPAMIDVCIFA
jgi:hypothetical protein